MNWHYVWPVFVWLAIALFFYTIAATWSDKS